MSAAHSTTRLETSRRLLEAKIPAAAPTTSESAVATHLHMAKWREVILVLTGIDIGVCLRCGGRALVRKPLPCVADARAPARKRQDHPDPTLEPSCAGCLSQSERSCRRPSYSLARRAWTASLASTRIIRESHSNRRSEERRVGKE